MSQRISISVSNLLLVFAIVLLSVLLWQLRSLIVVLMISTVLAASIAPIVNKMEQWRFPRWLSVILVYLTLLGVLTGFGVLAGPTVFAQIELLARRFPGYFENVRAIVETWVLNLSNTDTDLLARFFDTQSLTNWIFRSSQQLLLRSYGITRGIVGSAIGLLLSLFVSGYMVADSTTLIDSAVQLFPHPWNHRLAGEMEIVSNRMGGYIRGRLLVSAILGIATATGLSFLGLREFSLALGAIAAVTNLIPFIGPILGAIPAAIVALSLGWLTFTWVLVLFVVIQNIETYILDPLLVGSSVGVHPLYQLLAVLGGVQVLGIIGALIIPPWFAGVAALVEGLYLKPKLVAERGLNED